MVSILWRGDRECQGGDIIILTSCLVSGTVWIKSRASNFDACSSGLQHTDTHHPILCHGVLNVSLL